MGTKSNSTGRWFIGSAPGAPAYDSTLFRGVEGVPVAHSKPSASASVFFEPRPVATAKRVSQPAKLLLVAARG